MNWEKLPRSERATVDRCECDVWPVGKYAQYSVLDTQTGVYVSGGKCDSIERAKQVSAGIARIFSKPEYQEQIEVMKRHNAALEEKICLSSKD